MAKPEWGTKRICQSCGARFYDLQQTPIVCPKCKTPYQVEADARSRRSRPATSEKPKKRVPEAVVEEADEVVATGQESGEEMIEDVAELGDDEELDEVGDEIVEKE